MGNSPGWWAATVATYCPSRPEELPKSTVWSLRSQIKIMHWHFLINQGIRSEFAFSFEVRAIQYNMFSQKTSIRFFQEITLEVKFSQKEENMLSEERRFSEKTHFMEQPSGLFSQLCSQKVSDWNREPDWLLQWKTESDSSRRRRRRRTPLRFMRRRRR